MIKFISFADCRMRNALLRIKRQAVEMGIFDSIEVFDETTLMPDLAPWLNQGTKRRFAYYCWKPYLIFRELSKLEEGDILVYCDAGCHLIPAGKKRFQDYLRLLESDPLGVKLFEVAEMINGEPCTETRCTKGDVFEYFHCRDKSPITESLQYASGHIFCRCCASSLALIEQWDQSWRHDFSLLTDEPSRSPNSSLFQVHRHDQSLLSIIYKQAGGSPLPYGETWSSTDWDMSGRFPILDLRDKGMHTRPLVRLWLLKLGSLLLFGNSRKKCKEAIRYTLRRKPFLKAYLPWQS